MNTISFITVFTSHLLCVSCVIAHSYGRKYEYNTHEKHTNNFSVYWNIPTQRCLAKFGIDVDVRKYGIITNLKDGWTGEKITILPDPGLYPHVVDGTVVNGGIPQNADIDLHVRKLREIISSKIPLTTFSGLAIVDYEAWRPLWSLNFDSKEVYRKLSVDLVRKLHPHWTEAELLAGAKVQFEAGARKFLEVTMRTVRRDRPFGKWGYYHYPYCYNQDRPNRTECSQFSKDDNDMLHWLFHSEGTLYPSAYLSSPQNKTLNWQFVKNRLAEAKRVQNALSAVGKYLPMYLYTALIYTTTRTFHNVDDLNSTINQAMKMGLDGAVIWGDHFMSDDRNICTTVKTYVDTVLGPFVHSIMNY